MFRPKTFGRILLFAFALAWGPVALLLAQQQTGTPAPLPASKEGLLAELSPETKVGEYEDYVFHPATLRFATRMKRGKQWVLVVDGREGPAFDAIAEISFSPEGRHVFYRAKRAGKWFPMMDEKRLGPEFNELRPGPWHFGPGDLLVRHAYAGKRQNKKWLMVTDGKEGAEFEEVGWPVFSSGGEHLAYWARREKEREVIVVDGKEGPEFEEVGPPVFSTGGEHLAYSAKRGNQWLLLVDGKEGPAFDEIHLIAFSPEGKHIVYNAYRANKWVLKVDDKELSPEFDAIGASGIKGPSWAWLLLGSRGPDAYRAEWWKKLEKRLELGWGVFRFGDNDLLERHAYAAKRGSKWLIVLDGKEGPEFDEVGPPVFSPDGQRLAYRAKRARKWLVVVDGTEGPRFDDPLSGPLFSDDSQHVAYIMSVSGEQDDGAIEVRDGQQSSRFVLAKGMPLITSPGEGMRVSRGVVAQEYVAVNFIEYLTFSPDGHRLVYVLGHGGTSFSRRETQRAKRRVVVDGREGKQYDALEVNVHMFISNSCPLVYAVRGGLKENKSAVVIDDQEGKLYDDIVGLVLGIYEGGDPLKYVVTYVAREGRKFYRVTQPLS